MKRRQFIKGMGVVGGTSFLATRALGKSATAAQKVHSISSTKDQVDIEGFGSWSNFELNFELNLGKLSEGTVYLPLPDLSTHKFQQLVNFTWKGNFDSASVERDSSYSSSAFIAKWNQKNSDAKINVSCIVKTRDRSGIRAILDSETRDLYLQPTPHMPTDGIVKKTSQDICKKLVDHDQKALAIYNWVVEKSYRDPQIKGCGLGDIASMLESGNLGGKCADINSLFVGLCRSQGVPAREVFGIRVGDSKLYKSVGKSGDVSRAQHCRAEYYSEKKNAWIPVDAADVRKVILEENKDINSSEIINLRKKLFGFWEMNWIAFNSARDFSFSETKEKLNYFMYPQVNVNQDLRPQTSPDECGYKITSKKLS